MVTPSAAAGGSGLIGDAVFLTLLTHDSSEGWAKDQAVRWEKHGAGERGAERQSYTPRFPPGMHFAIITVCKMLILPPGYDLEIWNPVGTTVVCQPVNSLGSGMVSKTCL